MRNAFIASSRSLASLAVLAALAGCSSLTQAPAQIESGQRSTPASTPTPNRGNATPGDSGDGAVVTPLTPSAPVRPNGAGASGSHVVQPGETLYRISVTNGLKYQDVAAWNQLSDFNIKVGQVLRLTPPDGSNAPAPVAAAGSSIASTSAPVVSGGNSSATLKTYPKALKQPYSESAARTLAAQSEGSNGDSATTNSKPAVIAAATAAGAAISKPAKTDSSAAKGENSTSANAVSKPATKAPDSTVAWGWPTDGKVSRGYSDSNKGIDIPGKLGQPVLAAADGKVVYSGNGLRGYGKLIIIKHDKTFLSAYAHNSSLLVKEGQTVRKGQKIAEIGNTDADQVKLHFEIRRFGKPVDPAQYLDSPS